MELQNRIFSITKLQAQKSSKIFLFMILLYILSGTLLSQDLVYSNIRIEEVNIPMEDGINLNADLYMPNDMKKGDQLPVILEYLPYRKNESRSHRFPLYSYFVQHGYIVARVDIRGTGKSDGKLVDGEYSETEQEDGETIIDWLSKQNFSTGKIAILGISWGGFNGLHLAMRKPPALKTVISLMSTDDIYQDDVHFIDGMMHIDAYEIGMDITNAIPGAPDYVIDEAYFKNRFEAEPWLLKYKREQTDGPFWDRASLNEDYTAIDIPLFIIGGWYDGYRDFIPRILKHADVPVKAVLGPWNHTWPNWAQPEPAVEWRDMAVRWLDYWLKEEENGIMEEPS
jgi:putative CocE/NonD family hydrolase